MALRWLPPRDGQGRAQRGDVLAEIVVGLYVSVMRRCSNQHSGSRKQVRSSKVAINMRCPELQESVIVIP